MTGTDSGWSNGSTQDASEESEGQSSASVYQDAKLIRRAYLQVQTETFDQAVESLEKMVAECGVPVFDCKNVTKHIQNRENIEVL